jgi:HAMP domain-containing protein
MRVVNFKRGIRGKAIVPVSIILILALGCLAVFNYYSQVMLLNREAERSLRTATNSTQNIINEKLKQYQQLAALVAGMPTPSHAFSLGERQQLISEFSPVFNTLKKDYGIAQFQYHLPLATSFLRLHQIEKYGDDLTEIRQTVVTTNKMKVGTRGIEVGRGGLGLRGVMPVTYQGKHVGSVEFGGELAPAIDEAKQVSDIEIGVVLSLTAESAAWPEWQSRSKKIGEYVLFYSTKSDLTNKFITPSILSDAQKNGDKMVIFSQSIDGRYYHIALSPLKDYSGKIIGYLSIFKDNSELVSKIRLLFFVTVLIYISLLFGVVWAINKAITKAVIDPIIKLTVASDNISKGKLEEKIEIKSDDEIQVLAKSIDRMRISIKKMLGELT